MNTADNPQPHYRYRLGQVVNHASQVDAEGVIYRLVAPTWYGGEYKVRWDDNYPDTNNWGANDLEPAL